MNGKIIGQTCDHCHGTRRGGVECEICGNWTHTRCENDHAYCHDRQNNFHMTISELNAMPFAEATEIHDRMDWNEAKEIASCADCQTFMPIAEGMTHECHGTPTDIGQLDQLHN